MDTNAAWAKAVLDRGLAAAYVGNYFPLQYQLFALCEWVASALQVDSIPVYKAENLAFDIGAFWILVALLKNRPHGWAYALIYWLHPWFLSVFSLGYVDAQFSFFTLLFLWFAQHAATPLDFFVAGVPAALALLMKPQPAVPAVGVVLYLWLKARRTSVLAEWWMLVPAVLMFGAYELYFAASLYETKGAGAALVLPVSYLRIGSIQPVLTAHMPNVWYPIAFALKERSAEIWSVSSKIHILPYVQVRFFALALTMAVVAWYARKLAAVPRWEPRGAAFFYLVTFSSLAVPVLMTSAHENHLFLPSVLLVAWLAEHPSRAAALAVHLTLVLQAVNLEAIYGFYRPALFLRSAYSQEVRLLTAVVSIALFAVIGRELCRNRTQNRF